MEGLLKFRCECCGEMIDQWPALTFGTLSPYFELPPKEQKAKGRISPDFCVIIYPDQTDRFIRVVLNQKVNDHCSDLEYGVWVSMGEKNFKDYQANFHNDNYEATFTGYLSNRIPGYEHTLIIPMTIRTRKGGQRPETIPMKEFRHPFVIDYYEGISKAEAERRIRELFLNKLPKN